MCLGIGWYAGLVFMGVLFAPFVRKFGAYTVPTFLGRRFESRIGAHGRGGGAGGANPAAAGGRGALCRLCGGVAAGTVGAPDGGVVVVACAADHRHLAGGMRSLTWSSVAQAIAAMLALAVPATIMRSWCPICRCRR